MLKTFVLKWIIRKSIEAQQKLKWLEFVSINLSIIETHLFSQEQLRQLYWGAGQGKLTTKLQKANKKSTVVLPLLTTRMLTASMHHSFDTLFLLHANFFQFSLMSTHYKKTLFMDVKPCPLGMN